MLYADHSISRAVHQLLGQKFYIKAILFYLFYRYYEQQVQAAVQCDSANRKLCEFQRVSVHHLNLYRINVL